MNRLITILLFLITAKASFATWAQVQAVHNYCGTVTTCTMTIPAPTAGDLLALTAMYNGSSVTISSVSGDGAWVHPSGCQASASGYQAVDWAYNLSATSGTNITITFSASAQYTDVFYFEYSGTAPVTYDTCGVVNGGTSYINPPAGSITTTGSNDLALAGVYGTSSIISSSSSVTPAPPWGSTPLLVNGGEALDSAMNFSAQTTEAVFTASASDYDVGSTIAFKDATGTDYMAQIANDMDGSHEGTPHGVPSSYDWYSGPEVEQGNTPPAGTRAIVLWGGLYVDSTNANAPTNTLVDVRKARLYILSKSTGQWTTALNWTSRSGNSQPGDQTYSEDSTGGPSTAVGQQESDGTMSYIAGANTASTDSACLAHFYRPCPWVPITASDVAGVVAVFEAS
jgi:hypothetical protein